MLSGPNSYEAQGGWSEKGTEQKCVRMTGTLKKKGEGEKEKYAEPQAKKQEAYSQVICHSERRLYLDGVILLLVKLCRESLSCRIPHFLPHCCRAVVMKHIYHVQNDKRADETVCFAWDNC